jgi:hypothetical protein
VAVGAGVAVALWAIAIPLLAAIRLAPAPAAVRRKSRRVILFLLIIFLLNRTFFNAIENGMTEVHLFLKCSHYRRQRAALRDAHLLLLGFLYVLGLFNIEMEVVNACLYHIPFRAELQNHLRNPSVVNF